MVKGSTILQTVAIYGGSFDPMHNGHLQVIQEGLKQLPIDKLIVVPNYLNPFKTKVIASSQKRLQWLKEVTKPYKDVIVSDFEIQRKQPTPSIITVKHFLQKYDKIYFIIGADNLKNLHRWQDFATLDRLVTWVVATREGYESANYQQLNVCVDISSSSLRRRLDIDFIPKQIQKDVKETYAKDRSTS